MGCDTKTTETSRTVWTDGATTLFVPFVRLRVNDAAQLRTAFMFTGSTGNFSCRPQIRYSDDGETWGALANVSFGATMTSTADAWQWGASFTTADVSKQWVEIGISSVNTSGTNINLALATLRVDVRN